MDTYFFEHGNILLGKFSVVFCQNLAYEIDISLVCV